MYYKCMKISDFRKGQVLDTRTINYGLEHKSHILRKRKVIEGIVELSRKYNEGLSVFFHLLFITQGSVKQLYKLEQEIRNGDYEYYQKATTFDDPYYGEELISSDRICTYIDELKKCNGYIDKGYYLWEHLAERVRILTAPEKPSRLDSYFLFDSEECLEHYMKHHLEHDPSEYCRVCMEPLDVTLDSEHDMDIWNTYMNNLPVDQVETIMKEYWTSRSPMRIKEVLFQGILKTVDRLD